MKLANLKKAGTARMTVLNWLDEINEHDDKIRAEVIHLCEDSVDYRKWIIGYIGEWRQNGT